MRDHVSMEIWLCQKDSLYEIKILVSEGQSLYSSENNVVPSNQTHAVFEESRDPT